MPKPARMSPRALWRDGLEQLLGGPSPRKLTPLLIPHCCPGKPLLVTLDSVSHYPAYTYLRLHCSECAWPAAAIVTVRVDMPWQAIRLQSQPLMTAAYQDGDIYLLESGTSRLRSFFTVAGPRPATHEGEGNVYQNNR